MTYKYNYNTGLVYLNIYKQVFILKQKKLISSFVIQGFHEFWLDSSIFTTSGAIRGSTVSLPF